MVRFSRAEAARRAKERPKLTTASMRRGVSSSARGQWQRQGDDCLTFAWVGLGLMNQQLLEDEGRCEHDQVMDHLEDSVPEKGATILVH
jgi:hypothetical protein